jgi:hypothetical protein
MKKALLILLSVGLIAGVAVACGGSDVENVMGAGDIAQASDDITDGMYTGGDFTVDNDEFEYIIDSSTTDDDSQWHIDWGVDITLDDDMRIDWGSDIIFDIDNIILHDFDEPCYEEDLLRIKSGFFPAGIPEGMNVKAGRFNTWEGNDGYFISHDGSFAFRIDDDTEVILEDGIDFIGGDLNGRRIMVIYGVSTRNIPEMTTASKLIVLYESVVPVRY